MLEAQIGEALRRKGLTLALAESATGGRVADRITDVPGSSDYFLGGVVAYGNEAKVRLLGVREETLREHGAVSEETALEMAEGARRAFGADVGASTTGIAGPSGATPTKPVGLVYVAVSAPWGAECERHVFQGTRGENKEAFTRAVLALLLRLLQRGA